MNTSVPAIQLRLEGAGWSCLTICGADASHQIDGISYLTNALDDLVRLGLDLATDRGWGTAQFEHEPGATLLIGETGWWTGNSWESGARLSAVANPQETKLTWSQWRELQRLFVVDFVNRDALAGELLRCAEAVLSEHGIDGYAEQWGGALAFPTRGVAALKSALHTKAVSALDWGGGK